jgi:peptide/nickel transport system permease protein
VLIGISLLAFTLMSLLPGDTAVAILGADSTNAQIAALNKKLGLNFPFWHRYGLWLWHAIHGNLGVSLLSGQPVVSAIKQRLPVTTELVVLAVIFALVTAIPGAILAARRPFGFFDRVLRSISTTAMSIPGFILGLVLILVAAVKLGWLPAEGFVPLSQGFWPNLKTMILPAISIGFLLFGTYSRVLRSDLVDQMTNEDYVQTARTKGLSTWEILTVHVFRNSLFSMITIVATNVGVAIGGTVIIENIFNLPGIGQLLETAILTRDVPIVLGVVVVVATCVVAMNFLSDVAYLVLDHRVRSGFERG